MKKNNLHLFALTSLILMTNFSAFAAENKGDGSSVDRYAVYIGSNEGGNNKRLFYAGTDATAFQKTMSDIGGIRKANSILLLDPAKEDVDNAMEYISTLINRNKENAKRSEFVFYYSGHSDENALLLGNTSYDYSSLKASISKVPSDVHVVILDSCYSGNFIRTKGGQKQKPFLVDDSSVIKGHAYLSSSSSQEFSQESDEIGSSFFTNAMITGLRGAADSSGDKKVTLNELYSYAFSETLSKTENSSVGPQHPNYNITLVGSGDLVLSDISESDCVLTLAKELTGRVIIRDKNEKLVSEINKTDAGPIYLAMESGQYGVTVISERATLQGSFELGERKNFVLTAVNLSPVIRKSNVLRGEDAGMAETAGKDFKSEEELTFIPFAFSVLGSDYSTYEGKEVKGSEVFSNFSIGLLRSESYRTDGLMLSVVENRTELMSGVQMSLVFNRAGRLYGVQDAMILNNAGTVYGAQISSCVNVANSVKFIQAAGFVNIATGDLVGGQGAGLLNYAGKIEGAQGAGIGNVCEGIVDGAQGAGLFNYATGDIDGAQGAGLLNIAGGKVDGVQGAAIFNYAKSVDGVQAGFINICKGEVEGFQFGLINYSKNGLFEIETSCSTEKELSITLKSGKKNFYSIIGFAQNFKNFNKDPDSYGDDFYSHIVLGLGTRFGSGSVNLDLQVIGNEILVENKLKNRKEEEVSAEWYPSVRTAIGFYPHKHFGIFVGAALSLEVDENKEAFVRRPNSMVMDTSSSKVKLHPEFDAGVRVRF